MLSSLNQRFEAIESNESLVLATLLDPCFKDKFFSGTTERTHAKTLLETKLSQLCANYTSPSIGTEPPEKRAKTDIMKVFDEIIDEAGQWLQHRPLYIIV